MGWVVNSTPRPLYPLGKRPGTHCTGAWAGPRARVKGCEKFRPHQDSIPGPSTRSESLYRLRYRGPQKYTSRMWILWGNYVVWSMLTNLTLQLQKKKTKKTENIPNFKNFFIRKISSLLRYRILALKHSCTKEHRVLSDISLFLSILY
jgi:hypothetical protein